MSGAQVDILTAWGGWRADWSLPGHTLSQFLLSSPGNPKVCGQQKLSENPHLLTLHL